MRRTVSRALDAVLGDRGVSPLAVKVPQITALFWVAKVTSTAMGEALADFLDGGAGLVLPALGALLSLALFMVALRRQLRRREYDTASYWFAVAMVATFGTMAADSLHQFLGIPYGVVTAIYATVLAGVFWRWWSHEHTLSIHSIDTRRREHFYWATVLSTFALGTAAGDWTATDLHLGFFSSGLIFAGAILVPAIAYRLGVNPIVTFWAAYIITRPLGASFADWFDYPRHSSGLGWSTLPVWTTLAVVMVAVVTVIGRRERRNAVGDAPPQQHWSDTHPQHVPTHYPVAVHEPAASHHLSLHVAPDLATD
jgi:uncharacterized membrane-anchored protein